MTHRCLLVTFAVMVAVHCAGLAFAQGYPNKPVRILTSTPGSGNDLVARLLASELTRTLGQQFVVDNRSFIAVEIAAKAPPDGYTLLLYGAPVWLLPLLRDHVPYDPVKDFAPLTLALRSPNILVVFPALPIKSVAELVAMAKAKPGQLNYAAGAIGAAPHLAMELFKATARVDILRVPYKGTGPSISALIAGEVHVMIAGAGGITPHLKSGRLRALGVTSVEPSALVPDMPTVAATVPGYKSESLIGVFAPARTPAAIVALLSREMAQALNRADIKERLFKSGEDAVGSTADEFAATIKSEMARWGKVIREAGIREE